MYRECDCAWIIHLPCNILRENFRMEYSNLFLSQYQIFPEVELVHFRRIV